MKKIILLVITLSLSFYFYCAKASDDKWILVDDFENESAKLSSKWFVRDVQNETKPFVPTPQIAELKAEAASNNTYYLKKAAADGVIGNRKALSYVKLPVAINVGETYTLYTRFLVESFPNNHSFGLSNMSPNEIDKFAYNAFEPMLRVTDKTESNGVKNTGALMVIKKAMNGKAQYENVKNPETKSSSKPLIKGVWYEVWYVINNASQVSGGQTYEVYLKGGEFTQQQKVYEKAEFRMKRESALTHFITIANTGPDKQPYGNGGLAYDDIYMGKGLNLSRPN